MLLFFALSCLLVATEASCPVEITPSRVVVKFGEALTANCTSTSKLSDIKNMGWESPQGSTDPQKVTFVPLQIKQLQNWVLKPQCYINLVSRQCSKDLEVTVYQPPDKVIISTQMVPLKEGNKMQINCEVAQVFPRQNLQVLWYKGDVVVHTVPFDQVSSSPVDVRSHYNWTARKEDDGAGIRCEAKLEFGPTGPAIPVMKYDTKKLTVFYAPQFTESETRLTLKGSEGITLDCTVAANPAPEYTWQLPPSVLNQPTGNQPVLNVTFPMPGTYSCNATNLHGSTTKSFVVAQDSGDQTVMAAVIATFVTLGVLLAVAGYFLVKADGTFTFCKSSNPSGVL